MLPFRCSRILVPTDLSPPADRAVRYAHGLAELCQAELHVLHVAATEADRLRLPAGVVDGGAADDDSDGVLGQLLGEPGGVRRVEVVRVAPDVPEAILKYARAEEIELVVMSTHGHSGLHEALVGSVAHAVVRSGPCPVLLVPARDAR